MSKKPDPCPHGCVWICAECLWPRSTRAGIEIEVVDPETAATLDELVALL